MRILLLCLALNFSMSVHAKLFSHDRAAWHMQKGEFFQAKELLTQELARVGEAPELLYDLGLATYKAAGAEKSDGTNPDIQKELITSRAYFDQVTKLGNSSIHIKEKAHFNAGNISVDLNKLQEAISHYEKVLEINPKNDQAKYNLEKVKEMLKKQQQEQQQKQNKENKDQQEDKDKQDKDKQENKKQQQNQDKQTDDQKKQDESHDQQKDAQDQQNNKNKEDTEKKQQPQQQQKNEENDQQESEAKHDQEKKKNEEQQDSQADAEDEEEKNEQQKPESEKGASAGSQAQPKEAQEKNGKGDKKMEAWLAQLLNEQEKKDAAMNKQMIRATVDKKLAGNDGQNCW